MAFFTTVGGSVDKIFEVLEKFSASDMMSDLASLLSLSLSIMIIVKAYAFLSGKSNELIKDIVYDGIMKLIIIAFALNMGGWLSLVIASMNEIHAWAGGGKSLYAELDNLLEATKELAGIAYEAGNLATGIVSSILIYIGFGLGALPALLIIIVTSLTLKILVLLAPFMFFALFYGWLKNVFTQWLSLFITNTLTVLIITILLKTVAEQLEFFIDFQESGLKKEGLDPVFVGFQLLITGILLAILVITAKEIAEKLGTVSIEGVMQKGLLDARPNGNKLKFNTRSKK